MANNLFVSYDLNSPGQNYNTVITAIKSLGGWAKVHKSLWYVDSTHTAASARDVVWKVMDKNDTLLVVDATNKASAWENLSDEVAQYIRDHWNQ